MTQASSETSREREREKEDGAPSYGAGHPGKREKKKNTE